MLRTTATLSIKRLEVGQRSFERRGYPLLLTSATVTDMTYLERVRAALPTEDILAVRLTAPPEVLRARIVRREPADWVGLLRLLDATRNLAKAMTMLSDIDLVLDTEAHDVEYVVATIREALMTT